MATVDLTRSLFEPRKRYTGVRMQQGRVVLDDDHNEAHDLHDEDGRRTRVDVIGPSGSPDDGFVVSNPTLTAGRVDFDVARGTMYVGGIPVRLDHDTTFAGQPDWVGIRNVDRSVVAGSTAELVYLEVWQQPVGAEEDRELLEPALGGPDTTVRMRTMARVRRRSVANTGCAAAWDELVTDLAAAGHGTWNPDTCEVETDLRLRVDYVVGGVPDDLCSPSVAAGYLGAENQAIRVQLVEPVGAAGDGNLTWGYHNGSPLFRARRLGPTVLALDTPPRDEAHWPLLGQTVEVLPWSAVLVPSGDPTALTGEVLADGGGRAVPTAAADLLSVGRGHLTSLASSYDPTSGEIVLSAGLAATFNARGAAHVAAGVDVDHDGEDRSGLVFVRIWDRGSDVTSPARLPFVLGAPLPLGNSGIRVTLTGDDLGADAHWILAARPRTPDRVMPWALEDADGRAPNGVRRFLTPLAVITWDAAGTGEVHDCRETFRPLTRIRSCCRYTVGDGTTSHGDFLTVQAAVDNLPAEGGEICVLPGLYPDPVRIEDRADVTIHGCGARSVLRGGTATEAVVTVRNASGIVLRGLAVTSEEGFGVHLQGTVDGPVRDVELDGLEITVRDRGGVLGVDVSDLWIHGCHVVGEPLVAEPSPTGGSSGEIGRLSLVAVQGTGLRIEDNRVEALDALAPSLRVAGGVQIGGPSTDVGVDRNRILGGNGTGIVLGSVDNEFQPGFGFGWWVPDWYWDGSCLRLRWIWVGFEVGERVTLVSGGTVQDLRIRDNTVRDFAGDGIGVALFFDDLDVDEAPDDLIVIRQLRVERNLVTGCNTGEVEVPTPFLSEWSGHGPIALATVEDGVFLDNELRDNGPDNLRPLVGLFVLDGSGLTIERNRIGGNGNTRAEAAGFQGGVILMSVAPWVPNLWDGRASARIVGNQVAATAGPALRVVAQRGAVVIQGNELTTTTVPVPLALGSVVDVRNAGLFSEDFQDTSTAESVRPEDGGQIVFCDNVTGWVDQTPTFLLWTHVFFTWDDVKASDNTTRVDFGEGAAALLDWFVFGITVDVSDNRVRETPFRNLLSVVTMAAFNGTIDNVCTHCVLSNELRSGVVGSGVGNRSMVDLYDPTWCRSASAAFGGAPRTAAGAAASVDTIHGGNR